MAEKKTEKPVIENKYDPMQDYVSITLPRATGREQNFVVAALNGKVYKIMRGVSVRVPRPVAEIFWESERNKQKRDDYSDSMKDRGNPLF